MVSGLQDNYTVEWSTGLQHDGVLIEEVAGKYDLGGFNVVLAQPTPDQQFDFVVDENPPWSPQTSSRLASMAPA